MSFFHHQVLEPSQYYDTGFEVILVGPSGCGKSSLVNKFVHDRFTRRMTSTSGLDVGFKIVDFNGYKCKLSIFDTAGHDSFEELYYDYYARCHGLFLIFDLSDRASFLSLPSWIEGFSNYINKNTVIFLIGNKCDEVKDVQAEEIQKFCATYPTITEYFEVSALIGGKQLEEIFHTMITHILDQMIQSSKSMDGALRRGRPIRPRFSTIDHRKFNQHWQAVPWVHNHEQTHCFVCGKSFSWWKRYHHCRKCGNCVCHNCSPTRTLLPECGYDQVKQRVCNYCLGLCEAVKSVNARIMHSTG